MIAMSAVAPGRYTSLTTRTGTRLFKCFDRNSSGRLLEASAWSRSVACNFRRAACIERQGLLDP